MFFARARTTGYAALILAATSVPAAAQKGLPPVETLSPQVKASLCASYGKWKTEDDKLDMFAAIGSLKLSNLRDKTAELYPGVKEAIQEVSEDAWKNWGKIQAEGKNKNKKNETENMLEYMARRGREIRDPAWNNVKTLCVS